MTECPRTRMLSTLHFKNNQSTAHCVSTLLVYTLYETLSDFINLRYFLLLKNYISVMMENSTVLSTDYCSQMIFYYRRQGPL